MNVSAHKSYASEQAQPKREKQCSLLLVCRNTKSNPATEQRTEQPLLKKSKIGL